MWIFSGELNIQDGDLTIYQADQDDEDFYYYRFDATANEVQNTGAKYEIQLDICGILTIFLRF